MGRHKQPVDLVLLKGKANLTKQEIAERKAAEVFARTNKIAPPDSLPERLHHRFYWYVSELAEFNLMSNLDCDSLGRYVKIQDEFDTVSEILENLDMKDEFDEYKKYVLLMEKFAKELRMIGGELGFTMAARAKLSAPKKDKTVVATESERRFGNRL